MAEGSQGYRESTRSVGATWQDIDSKQTNQPPNFMQRRETEQHSGILTGQSQRPSSILHVLVADLGVYPLATLIPGSEENKTSLS